MSIADQYLSLPQYAERRGSSEPTLKKLITQAVGTPWELGEPAAEFGGTKVWHIDRWRGLEVFRLTPVIKEAIDLGFVVSVSDADEQAAKAWNNGRIEGYEAGLEEGRKQGYIASGSYEDGDLQ